LERNKVLLEPGQAAGSSELKPEGAWMMGSGVAVAGADADTVACFAVVVAALVVGGAVVFVVIPLAVEAPELVVAAVVVAATVEFPLVVIVGILEVATEVTPDDVAVNVGAGTVGFAALNPNINPNPSPSASARIINTANPHST
jgi:hypothetical protein